MKITSTMIEAIYIEAKNVYYKKISEKEARALLYEQFGVNSNSSKYYIYIFQCMMNGKAYERTINIESTIYFLEQIQKDFGRETYEKSLQSTKQHIEFYNKRGIKQITLQKLLDEKLAKLPSPQFIYPDEVDDNATYVEGSRKNINVNAYERNPKARADCIKTYGYRCSVCNKTLEEIYGEIGKNVIQVHHLVPLSEIRKTNVIDPIKDLRPVCPNCHAMLHTKTPPYTIEELQSTIRMNNKNLN